jgi:multidrug efflux pump subunit AcrA (membrane-fusion protein)
MRKIILFALGVVLLVIVIFASIRIANPKKEADPTRQRVVQNVYVEEVKNINIPILIPATGNVIAKERLELFAEVQGIFRSSSHDFKVGQRYEKGQTLISIDASEYRASVQSKKSNLYNLIASIMPDLRLDYKDAYPKWQQYLQDFQIANSTPPLPEFSTEQEKYFITGRNIQTTYYDLKNMEERLMKFNIRAPYSGIVTEALVTKGTLIRSGQKLGEFINTTVYEMEVSVPGNVANFLKIGEEVSLTSLDNTSTFSGTITRINASVNQTTQTVNVFLEIKDANVKEGMFLQANIRAKDQENAYKIPRRLLVNETQLFFVKDSVLDLLNVKPVFFSSEDVVVQGIPEGTLIVSRTFPGSYAGQVVKILDNDKPENTVRNTDTIPEN